MDDHLAEQQDEVTALESIFLDDFTILSDSRNNEPISFNLAVNVALPLDTINCEAWLTLEDDIPKDISADLRVTETNHRVAGKQDYPDGIQQEDCNEEKDGDPLDEVEVGAIGGATEVRYNYDKDQEQVLGAIGGIKPPTKFVLKRSISRRHVHLSTELRYLTPINMRCAFHSQYPRDQPPRCQLSCLWLNNQQLTILQHQLYSLWEESPGLPITFSWVDWLQNHALEFLDMRTRIVLKETSNDIGEGSPTQEKEKLQLLQDPQRHVPVEMALYNILQYDIEKQKEAILKGTHTCEICFDTKDGAGFTFLTDCQHSFCTECLRFHCEICIQNGAVLKLSCPEQNCKTLIAHTVLQDILNPEVYERWEKLANSKALDTMGDVVYCPRCNMCVVADDDETSHLAQCVQCFYTFCVDCLEPWHQDKPCGAGDEAYERKKPNEMSVNAKKKKKKKRYNNQNEDIEADDSEKSYGKKEKSVSSALFIRLMKNKGEYQRCPKCKFYVEKVSGCDFMHCSQCGSGFCWICGKAINSYNHFGNCNRLNGNPQWRAPERQPTEGDLILERYREENPNFRREVFINCPRCRQRNLKTSTNNHLKCWACKTNFCCQCRQIIQGLILNHFLPSLPCSQHSDK